MTVEFFFVLGMLSTALRFGFVGKIFGYWDVFWMIPVMGFCQIALFGGYAIYFPELFATHLRSTGTSFCYNVGRLVAAPGSTVLKLLESRVFSGYFEPARVAGMAMCGAFLIGLLALAFAPETKNQPLPRLNSVAPIWLLGPAWPSCTPPVSRCPGRFGSISGPRVCARSGPCSQVEIESSDIARWAGATRGHKDWCVSRPPLNCPGMSQMRRAPSEAAQTACRPSRV
jgi:hypothetical protein